MKIKCTIICITILALQTYANTVADKIKPNIIIINIDDMGWRDVGFMGGTYYETPNIDSLAASGMVFTNGYASSANCAPSRACLMSGKWTPRHGIYTVGTSKRGSSKHRKLIPTKNIITLAKKHDVIPKVLQKHGYKTCHAGKWHLSANPLDYGFDVNIGGGHNGNPKSYYPPYKNVNISSKINEHLTDVIMENTINYIDTVSAPFFLYYAPYAVHTPIQAVDRLVEKYRQKPSTNGQNNAAYASMVENLDRNIGLLIKKLKDKGILDNTLIVFTSDNGGLYGITKQPPLRAGKGSYYEGGIRIPFFIAFKGVINQNSKQDTPVTHLDLFPTILHYAKVDYNNKLLDGNNISAILEGKSDHLKRPLYWHFPIYIQAYKKNGNENRDPLFRTRPGSVVRLNEWKLHYYFENNDVELYNLADDISEQNNLASIAPKKKKELLNYLKNWWSETKAPIPKIVNPEYNN